MSEILVEISRGEVIETIHRGDIVVSDNQGKLLHFVGNPDKKTYMRSSAKPLQALNVILSGAAAKFNFTDKEIAIMCSSHYAEDFHREVIFSILQKIGLTPNHILGGTVTSLSDSYALELAWNHTELNPIFSDCSGKHVGMLAVCVHKNYPLHNYLSMENPCQQEILEHLSFITEVRKSEISIGIDGCSAPVHAFSLKNMALGFAKISNPQLLPEDYKNACQRIFNAMTSFPEMIAGTNGFCTELMLKTNGKLIGKVGAEGVYCVGVKDRNIGFSVKIESGQMKVLPPVVMRILRKLNVLTNTELENLKHFEIIDNINDVKTVVGKIVSNFEWK